MTGDGRNGRTTVDGDHLFPPKGFDPQQATPETLDNYRLPRRPDPQRQPALHEAWHRIFQLPLDWVRPELATHSFLEPDVPRSQHFPVSATRIEDSRNWCGASIVPHDGCQFVQIFGEWEVPTPSLPPPYGQGPPDRPNVYKTSTWIGLDGDRRYVNSSLPQVGTAQNLTVAADSTESREYFAWFQWWARDQLKVSFRRIKGIDVQPGMRVMGLVWAWNPTHVVVLFRNFAPLNQITILFKHSPKIAPIMMPGFRPLISGATAEWIMERPTVRELGSTKLELFPNYTTVKFDHCVAGTAPEPGLPDLEEVLQAPRFKRLFEVASDTPVRTRFISMPKKTSVTSFEAKYGGF